jgi:hypothetical protein
MERKQESQKVCRKSKCRSAWRAGSGFGRYAASSDAKLASKTPDSIGSKPADKPDRPRIVAGAPSTPSLFHCATVPDGPDCEWKGGTYQRLEANNRRTLEEEHFASKLPKPSNNVAFDYCAACGREDDLVDQKVTLDGWITLCCGCRDKWLLGRYIAGLELQAQYAEMLAQIPDDLSIPDFLRATPFVLDRLAAA